MVVVGRRRMMFICKHIVLVLLLITTSTCEWPPDNTEITNQDTNSMTTRNPQAEYSIASMNYHFEFPLSCDVNITHTIKYNFTRGNFTEGHLSIPISDYDRLELIMITDEEGAEYWNNHIISDGSYYRLTYIFPEPIVGPTFKTFIFRYLAIQATKTFSRSGSSKNSFSWKTITKEYDSSIAIFNVQLDFGFHTQDDSIDCDPAYDNISEGAKSTTVIFPQMTNLPIDTELTHEISFPKRVTCKPASTYRLVAVGVVVGSIAFALLSTIVALIVRKIKQRRNEQFEQLEET